MKRFFFKQRNFLERSFQKTIKIRDKASIIETIGINFAFLIPFSTMILRMWFKERRSKRKKDEERQLQEKSILTKNLELYDDALNEIRNGQLKKAESLLKQILQERLTTFISPNDLIIIENKEKIANVSFSRGNFESSLVNFEI